VAAVGYLYKMQKGEKQGGADSYAGAGAVSSEALANVRTVRLKIQNLTAFSLHFDAIFVQNFDKNRYEPSPQRITRANFTTSSVKPPTERSLDNAC
jgi:hypothetical protein